jgi:phosphatidate cytidylyltransferase
MSLRRRTITAVFILVPVFVIIQFLPTWVYFLLLQSIIIGSLVEFYNLARRRKLFPRRAMGIIFALIFSASFYFDRFPLDVALFACILLASVYFLPFFNNLERLPFYPGSIAITLFGALYISFTLNYFYPLRVERGPYYLYFLFAIIFMGDSGAYFVGKLIGRHKLATIASPNKTWEGSFGGILFACAGALAAQQLLLRDIPIWKALLLGVLVHTVAQISDPLESLFKRAVGVKDSSNMLPGHGGILDRIDSLILATPFFYYALKILLK